jgi:transposase InsO family protein
MAIAMARSDARMRLLDASLVAAINHHAEAFGLDFKGWCAANNVSRSTAYRHKKRIEELGRWEPLSTRPKSRPDHQTPPEVEAEILQLRRELQEQPGQDCGADNVRYYLQQIAELDDWAARGWRVPSRATIHKIMKRQGLVRPQPRKRPKSSYRRFAYAQPRDCYQIDATEIILAHRHKAVVFEVLDDCTRLLVATLAWEVEDAAGAITAITRAFHEFGVPALVLADNGSAFTCRTRSASVSRFTRVMTAAGARLIHSSPYHPQTCGKIERHHRTFKAWLADQPAPANITELQAACDRYQHWYNIRRRHSAWNKPPQQAWDDAPTRGGPGHLPVQQNAQVKILTVFSNGDIHLTGRTFVSIGRAHAAKKVTVLFDGDHVTIYSPTGSPLGHLHIDWTQTRQQLRPAA